MNNAQVSLDSARSLRHSQRSPMLNDANFFAELSGVVEAEFARVFNAVVQEAPPFRLLLLLCCGRAWLSQCGSTPKFATPYDKSVAMLEVMTSAGHAQMKSLFQKSENVITALSKAVSQIDTVIVALAPITEIIHDLGEIPTLSSQKFDIKKALMAELFAIVGCRSRLDALGEAVHKATSAVLFKSSPKATQEFAVISDLMLDISEVLFVKGKHKRDRSVGFWFHVVEVPVLKALKGYLEGCKVRALQDCLRLHERVVSALKPLTSYNTQLRRFFNDTCFRQLLDGCSDDFVKDFFPTVHSLNTVRIHFCAKMLYHAALMFSDIDRAADFQWMLCENAETLLAAAKEDLTEELKAASFLNQISMWVSKSHIDRLFRRVLRRHFEPKARSLAALMLTLRAGPQLHTALFIAKFCISSAFTKNALTEVLARLLIHHVNWTQMREFVALLRPKFAPQSFARLDKLLQEQYSNARAFPTVIREGNATIYRYLLAPLFRRQFSRDEPLAAVLRLPPPLTAAFAAFRAVHADVGLQLAAELREPRRPDVECLVEVSTAQVTLSFNTGRVKAVMTLPQLCVLLLFNERDVLSFKEIRRMTGLPARPLKEILHRFGEFDILLGEPDRMFRFNADCALRSGLLCLARPDELLT